MSLINKKEDADKLRDHAENMRQVIYKHGWDGSWFLRAYDAAGKKIGSRENKEGQIFIESQGWCIMGKAGLKNGYAINALESVNQKLATSNGIILQQPAYQTYYKELGEISSYPPGYKENAGIFTHNNTWVQIAETMTGNGDRAMQYYKSICPANKEEQIDIYRSEPYAYSQMTAGKDAPTPGEAKNSWLTGTAAWSFVSVSQYILGIRPDYHGLCIDPCLPKSWKKLVINRIFRGAQYEIFIENPNGVSRGIKSIEFDGKKISGNLLPICSDGKKHQAHVILG
jgi:cellobiose phosphorylase